MTDQAPKFRAARPDELDCTACGAEAGGPCRRRTPCDDNRPGSLPPSVRHGNVWAKLNWRVKGHRERLALRLAPWLTGRAIMGRPMAPSDHAALDEFLDTHRVARGGFTVVARDGAATVTLDPVAGLLLQVSDYKAQESAALPLDADQALYLSRALAYQDEEAKA